MIGISVLDFVASFRRARIIVQPNPHLTYKIILPDAATVKKQILVRRDGV